ncbi:hypothetical protein NQ314_003998 [Rhamnusium bicolor]|uniref:YEATS domain-containing protein n=1 Tax=Rhamnusium bicolor TaxID=1586634 RepID=A0AAV8ZMG1_9CUCU|nr:hypothetical protein NQ314_003998 [Rhamnusium bicolor]
MEPDKKVIGDPDYESNNSALRKIEGKEKEQSELSSEKLSKIIAEEFNNELSFRRKQLEEIEEKICKAQKLLHLVRYVLVTSYYNKKSLEYNSTGEESGISTCLGAQNRIHPAVKKLLGSNASLELLNSRGKRRVQNKGSDSNEASTSHSATVKKIKLERKGDLEDTSKLQIIDNNQNSLRNRKKTRYRIVIGNISKWMPSLENDNTTHKWMVYVRGLEETLDMLQIIDKVIFYLHPSYKPHDVVEVNNCPFHLSRRGWGEFPLRVQIFFKCPLNKPVSIIHNLKLDKSYTGRQTLGKGMKRYIDIEPVYIKMETDMLIDIKQEANIVPINIESAKFGHDYCHEGEAVKETIIDFDPVPKHNLSLFDHSYSLPYEEYNYTSRYDYIDKNVVNVANDQQNHKLIFGLDASYNENETKCFKSSTNEETPKDKCVVRTFTTATGQPIKILPQSFNSVLLSNGNIKLVNQTQCVLKKIDSDDVLQQDLATHEKPIDYERYKLTLPKNRFKNLGEVLPYLFKRLSLWNDLAHDLDFKCTYPFWSRARAIKRMISFEGFPDSEMWNTKTFFMYARSHGYSSLTSFGTIFRTQSMELDLLMSCFSNSLPQKQFSLRNVDDDIDVTTDIKPDNGPTLSLGKSHIIDITDKTLTCHCSFVKEAALDCGVVLKSEEIIEGVVMNAAERMIYEAVRCFAESLIRRSRHHLVCQENFCEETSEITTEEIKIALNERSEIKSIINFKKKEAGNEFFFMTCL